MGGAAGAGGPVRILPFRALLLALVFAPWRPGLAAADSPAGAASPRLEEIIVTAQKRAEKLSRVPISITALGKSQMDKQGVRDVKDVARLVPGLHLEAGGVEGTTNISIRGITSDTGAQTTGVYIDETPVQGRQEIIGSNPYPKVFDLDRVEVLRGPQGTLFGAGSEGGTIRFITPAPSLNSYSGYFRSELAFTDGGAPSYELGGAVGGPIVVDRLGFRVSLWSRVDGGYIDRVNPVTNQLAARNVNDGNSTVARAAMIFQPIDGLTFTPAIFWQKLHSGNNDYAWEDGPPFSAYHSAPAFTTYAQIPQPSTDTYILPSLEAAYDFGDFTLKSITSYFRRTTQKRFDATSFELSGLVPSPYYPANADPNYATIGGIVIPGVPNYLSTGYDDGRQTNWTQEVRLASNSTPESVLSWTVGAFIQNNLTGYFDRYLEPFDIVSNYLSEYYGYGPGNSLSYWGEAPVDGKYSYLENISVRETDLAGFGNLSYQPLPGLRLAAGLRVARSKYSFSDFQDGPYGPAAPTTYTGSQSETPVTPSFNVSYQISPTQMVYTTAAKGYRIGGANTAIGGIPSCAGDLARLGVKDAPHSFNSDSVWSYEVGSKGSYFGGRLRVDASLYWINWNAIQQQVYLPDCGYYYTANLGTAASRGFDLQADWVAGGGLTFGGTAGLTDARYTSTVTEGGNILAKSGDSLATPEWTATVSVQQDFNLPMDSAGYARLDDQFSGPYYRTGSADTFSYNPHTRDAPSTNFVSVRAGAKRAGWDVSLFIDNLLNSHVSLSRYEDTNYSLGYRDITFRPLTVGLTAIKKF